VNSNFMILFQDFKAELTSMPHFKNPFFEYCKLLVTVRTRTSNMYGERIVRCLFWTVPIFLWNGIRLFLFVLALAPGFARFAWYYAVTSDRISLKYGNESFRQTLDVYRPRNNRAASNPVRSRSSQVDGPDDDESICLVPAPVLVFYTGGAWMIGYKMWGALLARAITVAGIVVVIPDMRNYPLASVPSMVEDVDLSMEWTFDHIEEYGGDPTKVVMVGQSAGGHVACMAMFQKIRKILEGDHVSLRGEVGIADEGTRGSHHQVEQPVNESADAGSHRKWRPLDLKGFASISAPYSLKAMEQTFLNKGLDAKIVDRIFGHETEKYDPFLALEEFQSDRTRNQSSLSTYLPPIHIYHGTADSTVPFEGSEMFFQALQRALVDDDHDVSFVTYPGWSHTDPILEGPMDANQSLHRDLFDNVRVWTDSPNLSWPSTDPIIADRLCPRFLLTAGRFFNPF
jgi:prenylcysteine alpha-carboxyl methylesterase